MGNSLKFVLSVLSLIMIQWVNGQDYEFKLNLKNGQRFSLSSVMDMNMTMTIAGQDMMAKTKIHFLYTEEVKTIAPDGVYRMELTFARIAMDVDGITSMSYDTDKRTTAKSGPDASIDKVFGGIIGRKFYATVSPVGKVLTIDGLKEWVDSLSAGMDPASAQMVNSLISEDKLKSSLQTSYGYLPDHKVKLGDSWTQNIKMEIAIPVSTDVTYTLKEVKGNVAKVAIVSDSHSKDDNTEMAGTAMKIDLKSKMTGEGELLMNTGVFSKTLLNFDIKGTMEAAGTSIPVTSTGTSTTTITSRD